MRREACQALDPAYGAAVKSVLQEGERALARFVAGSVCRPALTHPWRNRQTRPAQARVPQKVQVRLLPGGPTETAGAPQLTSRRGAADPGSGGRGNVTVRKTKNARAVGTRALDGAGTAHSGHRPFSVTVITPG